MASSSRRARPPPPPLSLAPPSRPPLAPTQSAPSVPTTSILTASTSRADARPFADLVPIDRQHDPAKKSHMAPRSPNHTKRPPNSWILYRSDTLKNISKAKASGHEFVVPALVRAHPRWAELNEGGTGMPKAQSKASKLISLMWSLETREVRESFERLSELRKLEHARQFPDYKFQPRRPGAPSTTAAPPPSTPKRSQSARASSARPPRASASIDPPPAPYAPPPPPPPPIVDYAPHPYAAYASYGAPDEEKTELSGPIRREKHARAGAGARRKSKRSSTAASSAQRGGQTPVPYDDGGGVYSIDAFAGQPGDPSSSAAAYLAVNDPYATAGGQDILWALPPRADAPIDEWLAGHPPRLRVASGREQGVGLGLWGGEQQEEPQGQGAWGQSWAQPPFQYTDAGPSNYVLPSLSSDSHPTPSSAYSGRLPSAHASLGAAGVQYYEYPPPDEVSEAWPNPLGQSSSCVAGGPAELVRHEFLEGFSGAGGGDGWSAGGAVDDGSGQAAFEPRSTITYARVPSASVPGPWVADDPIYTAALFGAAPDVDGIGFDGAGGDDAHGLAAMWCLLDDTSSTISPFSLGPAGATAPAAGADAHSPSGLGLTGEQDPWKAALGLAGEWDVDGAWDVDVGPLGDEPTATTDGGGGGGRGGAQTQAFALAFDEGAVVHGAELSWTADLGRSTTSTNDDDGSSGGSASQLANPRRPPSPSFSPVPPSPSSLPIPASPEPAPEAAAGAALDAVTDDVARFSVGVPRRNTRVVGGSFRPPGVGR